MTTLTSPEHLITQVMRIVESDRKSEISLNANGGNSILLVCPPDQEYKFIQLLQTMLDKSTYSVIDLNKILISFVQDNESEIYDAFELLQGAVHQIFKTPEGEEGNDLYGLILSSIEKAYHENKVPVMIHSGALYGTGIDNLHLMESDLVMRSSKPLIILYPATHDGEKMMFLNTRPASKYRCMIVN